MSTNIYEYLGKPGIRPKDWITKLRKRASKNKSADYDDIIKEIRARYNDTALSTYVQTELRRRYPNSYKTRPMVNAGTVRQVAFKDARAYAGEMRQRWIESDGERADDDETTEAFQMMLQRARIDNKMRDLDRKRKVAGGMYGRVDFDSIDKDSDGEGRVRIQSYWGDQVNVLCHHLRPTSMAGALAIIADATGPDTGKRVDHTGAEVVNGGRPEKFFEVWHRTTETLPDGVIMFGVWHAGAFIEGGWIVELIGEVSGNSDIFSDPYYPLNGITPWFYLPNSEPDGSIVVHPGDSLLSYARNQDVLQSDMLHSVPANGSPGIMLFGAGSVEGKSIVFRNGEITPIAEADAKAQEFRADLSTVPIEIARDQSQRLAVNRRANRGAYDPHTGQAVSGFAKAIENRDEDQAAEEDSQELESFEQETLMPLMAKVSDYWGGTTIHNDKIKYRVDLSPAVTYETPWEKQGRVIELRNEKLLTDVDVLMALGIAQTEAEAEEYLAKLQENETAQRPEGEETELRGILRNALSGNEEEGATENVDIDTVQ